jgi:hypothetical protein
MWFRRTRGTPRRPFPQAPVPWPRRRPPARRRSPRQRRAARVQFRARLDEFSLRFRAARLVAAGRRQRNLDAEAERGGIRAAQIRRILAELILRILFVAAEHADFRIVDEARIDESKLGLRVG